MFYSMLYLSAFLFGFFLLLICLPRTKTAGYGAGTLFGLLISIASFIDFIFGFIGITMVFLSLALHLLDVSRGSCKTIELLNELVC
ncbi:hypothetical protein Pla110_13100 [Polystyrenella longa]|uniref:Uncharacterized protein n=1 Tax=Polystyrenella longa TaxID=2528007 RepID=A0A518CK36_9PLAN|nr:hypothetical protein Pla110_13100 [Polystyrenella longa]